MKITLEDIKRENEKDKVQILQGGYLSDEFLRNLDYKVRTNAEIEERQVLNELYENKHLLNRRMLYLEKRINDILAYMTEAGLKRSRQNYKKNVIILLVLVILMFLLYAAFPEALMPALIGIVLFFVIRYGNDTEGLHELNKDWEEQLQEMHEEHEKLAQLKDRLIERIEELEQQFKEQ